MKSKDRLWNTWQNMVLLGSQQLFQLYTAYVTDSYSCYFGQGKIP